MSQTLSIQQQKIQCGIIHVGILTSSSTVHKTLCVLQWEGGPGSENLGGQSLRNWDGLRTVVWTSS